MSEEKSLGQQVLIMDLQILLQDAEDGSFGDFTSKKYATPKIALVVRLESIANDARGGKFDG